MITHTSISWLSIVLRRIRAVVSPLASAAAWLILALGLGLALAPSRVAALTTVHDCTSLTSSISSSFPTTVSVNSAFDQKVLFTRTWTLTGIGCANPNPASQTDGFSSGAVYIPIGKAWSQLTGLPGVEARVVAGSVSSTTLCAASASVTSGTANPILHTDAAAFTSISTSGINPGQGDGTQRCNYKIVLDFDVRLNIGGGAYVGSIDATQFTSSVDGSASPLAIQWGSYRQAGNPTPYYANRPAGTTTTFSTATCSVADQSVTLSAINAANYTTGGLTSTGQSFDIQLSNCGYGGTPTGYGVQATWSFTAGASNTQIKNGCSVEPCATGVELQILDAGGTAISQGGTSTLVGSQGVTTNGGNYVVTYKARYITTAAATSGTVSGTATYTLSYQ